MGRIFKFLGLSVGTVTSFMTPEEKKKTYENNIIYGTNNEFGFDYLRDNMVYDSSQKVQTKLNYAIIDEVDSVLIDEARTPLVISGSATESSSLYLKINKATQLLIINNKDQEIYSIDEKQKSVSLTESGHSEVEHILVNNKLISKNESLYDPKNIQLLHLIDASLKANLLYKKDIDYVVENNAIVIIDEFCGRKMSGRRWSDGLHQAVEAKENLRIKVFYDRSVENLSRTKRNVVKRKVLLDYIPCDLHVEVKRHNEMKTVSMLSFPYFRWSQMESGIGKIY